MRGEERFEGGEGAREVTEERSEESPFKRGDPIPVRDNETGAVEDGWFFDGWEDRTGKALVVTAEGFRKKVDRSDLFSSPKSEKERGKIDKI